MNRKNGFTLVELAIALMVIGLLIGGVLKGQELIENAKITATIRQIKAYDTAAMIFQNNYGDLPGDIKHPTRVPNCTTEDICGKPGDGNGKIDGVHESRPQEAFNFFRHMTLAGMLQSPPGGTVAEFEKAKEFDPVNDPFTPSAGFANIPEEHRLFFPELPVEPAFIADFHYYNAIGGKMKNFYLISQMPVRAAAAIDTKIDNGKVSGYGTSYMHTKGCPYIDAEDINDREYDTQSTHLCHIVFIQADF